MAKSRNVANLIAANLLPSSNTITTAMIRDEAITTSKLASGAVALVYLGTDVINRLPVTITAVAITNSSYTVQPDTALSPSGGYIKLTGTGFVTGAQVYINNTPALITTFVSSTELIAQISSLTSGYYHIYVQNSNGSAAIRANSLYVSAAPTWITGSSIGGSNNVPFGIQLSGSSDSSVLYSLATGSQMPSGVSLTQLGYLSGTVSGLSTTTVYSIDIVITDSELQTATRTFTLSISVAEPFFKNNALLVTGNFTNSVTDNNTFLDTSVTAASVTKTGNVSQGTFSPFSQTGWSTYFNGAEYITYGANQANLGLGTGDFTVEFWFYFNASTVPSTEIEFFESQTTGALRIFKRGSSSGLSYDWYGGTAYLIAADASITTNAWHHVAVSRTSGTVSAYYDGTRVINQSDTTSGATPTVVYTTGGRNAGSNYFTGYISNLRLVKGTGLYSGATITVPTSALTTLPATTQLLICGSNRHTDQSANNYTISTFSVGILQIQAFSPFAPANSYSATLNGGSSYFDGNGDYLTVNPSSLTTIVASSATVEFWMYPLASDGYRRIITSSVGSFTANSFCIRYSNGSFVAGAIGGNTITSTIVPPTNRWHHIAWVGTSGLTQALYINGNLTGTSTTYSMSEAIQWVGGYYNVGPAEFFQGYIADVRIMKGTALFTGNFTPPSAPLGRTQASSTNVAVATGSTTSLLLNSTNFGVFDAAGKNNIETVGTVATQSIVFKYGGAALNFTGAGFLSMPNNPTLSLATGAFTVEAWVYISALPANNVAYTLVSNYSGTTSSSRYWWFGISTGTAPAGFTTAASGTLTFATTLQGTSTGSISAAPTWTYNVWNHIAVSRDAANNWYIFFNGVSLTTTTAGTWSNSNDFTVTTTASPSTAIGVQPANAANSYFVGYVDELRITKGVARFTANFTPATSDLASQ